MPPESAFNSGQKRKDGPTPMSESRNSPSKRARFGHPPRPNIPTQTSIAGLDSATGALDVASFVSAREFEIRALEKSMQRDRKGLSQRAFQQVPRSMRRRGASHNAKKVPKRLQKRAVKEMKEDNTPTVNAKTRPKSRLTRIRMEKAKKLVGINARIRAEERKKKTKKEGVHDPQNMVDLSRAPKVKKNQLVVPPKATTKFQKRQVYKTWLPTHLWHAKRARMTKPTEPLWRMALPLEPTEKSYRPTHRAGGGRGTIAWDVSYMATIGCSGDEEALSTMLQEVGFGNDSKSEVWGKRGAKWKNGTRTSQSWIADSFASNMPIAPCTVIWCPKSTAEQNVRNGERANGDDTIPTIKRTLFIRIHPSAFLQAWTLLLKIVKEKKLAISIEDLRFEIGSIELTGSASTEALQGVLFPATLNIASTTWEKLAGVTNPSSLPSNCVLPFDVLDTRLQTLNARGSSHRQNAQAEVELAELLATWPPDQFPSFSGLFSNRLRYAASRSLPSQKDISRRKGEAGPGKAPEPKATDPKIPVILLSSRPSQDTTSNSQGTWTVLMPWRCVDLVWRQLLFYPLSSGGTPRFGGLKQQQQLAFEKQESWFPGDYPGTDAGKAWNQTEDETRKKDWERKPPGRRINWGTVDLGNGEKGELGNGWSCDWPYLFNGKASVVQRENQGPETGALDESASANVDKMDVKQTSDDALKHYQHLGSKAASQLLTQATQSPTLMATQLPHLVTIRLRYLTRGTPNPAARIYCLSSPNDDPRLRTRWINVADKCQNVKQNLLKDRVNHQGNVRNHHVYPTENIEDYPVPGYDPAWDEENKAKNSRKILTKNSEPNAQSRTALAGSLLEKDPPPQADDLPPCPRKDNLIGFVTSGAYNLAQGRGTAIGSIWIEKIIQRWEADREAIRRDAGKQLKKFESEKKFVVVRNAGETVGRLATWELV